VLKPAATPRSAHRREEPDYRVARGPARTRWRRHRCRPRTASRGRSEERPERCGIHLPRRERRVGGALRRWREVLYRAHLHTGRRVPRRWNSFRTAGPWSAVHSMTRTVFAGRLRAWRGQERRRQLYRKSLLCSSQASPPQPTTARDDLIVRQTPNAENFQRFDLASYACGGRARNEQFPATM
jgi:hypothetical protein